MLAFGLTRWGGLRRGVRVSMHEDLLSVEALSNPRTRSAAALPLK